MKKLLYSFLLLALLVGAAAAQNNRAWTTLSKPDAEKILNESPWGKTQTDTDTTEMFFSPTKSGTASIAQNPTPKGPTSDQGAVNNNRAERGAANQAVSVNYHIRFMSARPIREAISRVLVLNPEVHIEALEDTMQTFVDRDFGQYIVLTVNFDSTDGRFSGPALQAFGSATAESLKIATYLERKDGKRLYLMDYRVPQDDGLGAKFVFPRIVVGKPFLDKDSGTVRFYSEVGDKIKLNVKYKISDMVRNGVLEY